MIEMEGREYLISPIFASCGNIWSRVLELQVPLCPDDFLIEKPDEGCLCGPALLGFLFNH
jgi:hypothetical protein